MKALTYKLQNIERNEGKGLGEFCDWFDLGTLLTFYWCSPEQNIIDISTGSLVFKINAEEQHIRMEVNNINLKVRVKFNMWTEPELISDDSYGTV